MFAGKVHTVLIGIAANNTGIWVQFLTHISSLDPADVGLIGSNFEHGFVLNPEQFRDISLNGQSFPGAVGRPHVLNVVLAVHVGHRGVEVAQVLVVGEVYQI